MNLNLLCVFCGSSIGTIPIFSQTAVTLANAMVERGYGLVYGGGSRGLMGIIATQVHEANLPVVGISPKRFHKAQVLNPVNEYILVDTMHQRKELMYRKADAFLAIPGGIGTLEEIAEIFTWNTIGFTSKPVAILNVDGFYNPFLSQLEVMQRFGFIKQDQLDRLIVSDTVEDVLDALEKTPRISAPWES